MKNKKKLNMNIKNDHAFGLFNCLFGATFAENQALNSFCQHSVEQVTAHPAEGGSDSLEIQKVCSQQGSLEIEKSLKIRIFLQ